MTAGPDTLLPHTTPAGTYSVTSHTWGRGPVPALFLHGFTGSKRSFDHLEPLLGDVLTATCVDLPGHDGAGLPHEVGAAGFIETVDLIAASLKRPHVVIGYSQGARFGLVLAQRHPHLVTRLIMESGSPGLRQRHDRLLRRLEDEMRAQQLLSKGVEAFIDGWEKLPLFEGLQRMNDAAVKALRARRLQHSADGLAGALRCLGQGVQPDVWLALPSVRMPTLVISGANDQKYTHLARRMVAELPLSYRKTFEGVGHTPHLECPEAYAAEISAFLAGQWTDERARHA